MTVHFGWNRLQSQPATKDLES